MLKEIAAKCPEGTTFSLVYHTCVDSNWIQFGKKECRARGLRWWPKTATREKSGCYTLCIDTRKKFRDDTKSCNTKPLTKVMCKQQKRRYNLVKNQCSIKCRPSKIFKYEYSHTKERCVITGRTEAQNEKMAKLCEARNRVWEENKCAKRCIQAPLQEFKDGKCLFVKQPVS